MGHALPCPGARRERGREGEGEREHVLMRSSVDLGRRKRESRETEARGTAEEEEGGWGGRRLCVTPWAESALERERAPGSPPQCSPSSLVLAVPAPVPAPGPGPDQESGPGPGRVSGLGSVSGSGRGPSPGRQQVQGAVGCSCAGQQAPCMAAHEGGCSDGRKTTNNQKQFHTPAPSQGGTQEHGRV